MIWDPILKFPFVPLKCILEEVNGQKLLEITLEVLYSTGMEL